MHRSRDGRSVGDDTAPPMEGDGGMAHTAHGLDRVTHWLNERSVDYELVTHPETFTAADEARAAGVPAGHVAKTLALHEHGSHKLVVIPASRRLDLVRLRELSGGSRHLRLAS